MEKVIRCLPPREAEEVLNMMLVFDNRPDCLVWKHEKSGQFSVKSAYRLFMSLGEDRQEGEVSYGEEQRRMWRKLWKMQVPNRVKIFVWRVCKNGLPSLKNLHAKKVVTEALCGWCKAEEEDINNALLNCQSFKDVLLAQLSFLQDTQSQRDFVQVMTQLASGNQAGEMEHMALCAWGLWYKRNKLMFENKKLSPKQVLDHALSVQQEYKSAKEEQRRGVVPQCRWQPPLKGVLKLNIDGAIFHDQCRSGVGMVLRDEGRQVILTASKPEHEVIDPMEIEFLAILRGLQVCLPLGISELEVESDSLLVVQELNREQESMSIWGNLVYEIKRLLHRFHKVTVQHRGRIANAAAHCLAKHSWHIDDLVVWWDSFLESVSQVIRQDALM